VTGPTGAAGATGATGPTGPTGALSSAYVDAYWSAPPQVVSPGNAVPFNTIPIGATIAHPLDTDFVVTVSGVYQVTVDLQGNSHFDHAQLSVNGVGVGPSVQLDCINSSCTVTRLLSVNAGDVIRLVNNVVFAGVIDTGSGITIVRIA
jgi:hypothetical protein